MDLDALDLPNGLHDAELLDVSFSPIRNELRLHIDAWVGDLAATSTAERERRRRCTVVIGGVGWFSIHPGETSRGASLIDVGAGVAPGLTVADAPVGTTMWWMYLQNTNSFLQIAGSTAYVDDDDAVVPLDREGTTS